MRFTMFADGHGNVVLHDNENNTILVGVEQIENLINAWDIDCQDYIEEIERLECELDKRTTQYERLKKKLRSIKNG